MPVAAAAISQTTNFLNEVFSPRASGDCPYDLQFQGLIRQHLVELVGVSGAAAGPLGTPGALVRAVAAETCPPRRACAPDAW